MTDINLKTLTPDTSLPTTGFLFGADSQASTNPSVYSTQTVATTLLGSTSLTGDVLTADAPVLNLAQTWNSSGTTFTGMKFNAAGTSDANSAAASLLMDLQVNTASKFKVNKSGTVTVISGSATEGSQAINFASNTAVGLYASGSQLYFTGNGVNFPQQIFSTSFININNDTSTFRFGTSFDLILGRKAAANLRFGAADAASPVAQTLSVQSIVAGQTNASAAAYPLTITGSQGTGTGAGGSIIFQVAPAGGSGTAQNALSTALTIASTNAITVGANGTISFPTSATTLPSAAGIGAWVSTLGLFGSGGVLAATISSTAVNLGSAYQFSWNSDTNFTRSAAGVVQVGTTASNASGTLKAAVLGTTTAYTVATLPTGFQGARAFVTDATLPTYLGALTGGGSVVCPVFYNGSAWVSA